jgi:hypothetical protein
MNRLVPDRSRPKQFEVLHRLQHRSQRHLVERLDPREPAVRPFGAENHQARNGADDGFNQRGCVALAFGDRPDEQNDMRRAMARSSSLASLARAAASTGGTSRPSSSRSTRAAASHARAVLSSSASDTAGRLCVDVGTGPRSAPRAETHWRARAGDGGGDRLHEAAIPDLLAKAKTHGLRAAARGALMGQCPEIRLFARSSQGSARPRESWRRIFPALPEGPVSDRGRELAPPAIAELRIHP